MLQHSDNTNTVNSTIRILGALEGDGVDAAIADSLPKIKSPYQLKGMLLTIGQRGYQAGAPALLAYASHKDAEVRDAALAALAQLGGREQLPDLVGLAVESIEAGNGNPYTNYIVQIASAIPDPNLRTEEIRKGAEQLSGKSLGEMLKMLGYLGGDAALETIKETLAGSDKEAKIGAILSLARWPDSSPNELLFKLATDKSDPSLQFVAVTAYVQNVARPSPLSAEKKLDQLKQVYAEIERPKDRKSLLFGLGSIIDPAAKELAESLASQDAAIAKYANAAAAKIEAGLQNLVVVTNDATLSAEHALLDAFQAKDHGSPDMLAITNWSHPQDRIYWPVRFQEPGTYSIHVTQACKEDDKDEYEITIAGAELKAKVVSTGSETKFTTEDIGTVRIDKAGGYTLGVAPVQIRGKILMNLRKIRIEKN